MVLGPHLVSRSPTSQRFADHVRGINGATKRLTQAERGEGGRRRMRWRKEGGKNAEKEEEEKEQKEEQKQKQKEEEEEKAENKNDKEEKRKDRKKRETLIRKNDFYL